MKQKKNILVLTSTFPKWRGDPITARFVYDLAKGLTQYYNVHILCPHSCGARDHEVIDEMEVFRFRYFCPSRLELISTGEGMTASLRKGILPKLQILPFLVSEIIALMLLIKRRNIHLVNTHWMIPQGFMYAVIRRFCRVPHVMTVHAAGIFALMRIPLGKMTGRFIVNNTDAIIAVSSYINKCIDDLVDHDTRATILPMGVDTKKFLKCEDRISLRSDYGIKSKYVLLFVGKLVPKKGLRYLIEAMQHLTRKISDIELIVVGGGPLMNILAQQARDCGVEKYVRFVGWVDNDELPGYYRLSDAVIVPSIVDEKGETEGMPVVVQEALSSGRPVIASRISGIPDVITNGYNGWLVEEKDSVGLSKKIMEVLQSTDLDTVEKNAFLTAKRYDWNEIARQYNKMIDGIIE